MATTVSLGQFGRPGLGRDATPALRAALATGAATIRVPAGIWYFPDVRAFPALISGRDFVGTPDAVWWFGAVLPAGQTAAVLWQACRFTGLTFTAPGASGFTLFGANSADLTFTGCTVRDFTPKFLNGAAANIVVQHCTFTQSDHPPAVLDQSLANVAGAFTVTGCAFQFRQTSGADTFIQVYGGPAATGPYTFTGNVILTDQRPGYVIDAAIDVEPHQSGPVGSVTIANNLIANGSIYVSGAQNAVVAGNTIHFTDLLYQQSPDHTSPITLYNSAPQFGGTIPPAGTIAITGNTVVCDPAPTTAKVQPLWAHGSGAIHALTIAGNQFSLNPDAVATATNAGQYKAGWFDPSVTAGWGTLVVRDNLLHVPGPWRTPGPLWGLTISPRGTVDAVSFTGNQLLGGGGAPAWVAITATAAPASVGTLTLTGNTDVGASIPLASLGGGATLGAAIVGSNPGFLPVPLPHSRAPIPWGPLALGTGALAAGAAAWWAWRRRPIRLS